MILPTKGISPDQALLTLGGEVLAELDEPQTVSAVWQSVRSRRSDGIHGAITFDWFVLALDLLRILEAVDLTPQGRLIKRLS